MKILWLCNTILPVIAEALGLEASNKEGWISGLLEVVLAGRRENGIELSVAFPLPRGRKSRGMPQGQELLSGKTASFSYYGFEEDVNHAEKYDESLEPALKKIVDRVEPDLVHCFGTEYPHTLAMCRIFPRRDRLLIGLQGLCTLYAEGYYANLPGQVIRTVTLRDYLRKDSLKRQQEKFVLRGNAEREMIGLAGNVTGRTEWDRENAERWNPGVRYYSMNETLRPEFYGPVWEAEKCIPHSIFLSQGDYPLKGLHYMLLALPDILAEYPDAKVFVAGNSLVNYRTLKEKLKISAYGKYLRRLMKTYGIENQVVFLGKLNAAQMRDRYLKSFLFVCPSSLENSPNSLGEAMLLGMPCVSADVGGISSIFEGGVDGILYEGFRMPDAEDSSGRAGFRMPDAEGSSGGTGTNGSENTRRNCGPDGELETVSGRLARAVLAMWGNPDKTKEYCANARRHAQSTHDRERNYRRLLEIYAEIAFGHAAAFNCP